jgi:hypothetical protein
MPVRELSSSPAMPLLFARAGAAMIPGASRLPFVGGGGGDIPDLTLVLNNVAVERSRVDAYAQVCGFPPVGRSLPATYPHMLAFPLHLALMTDASFPFPAIGLVHIYNRIVVHRPLSVLERRTFQGSATPVQPHPRGRQFSILTEARVGDELVWEEVSTNLRRGGSGGSGGSGDAPDVPDTSDLPQREEWKLAGDLGRRYGSVSGDMNPIHMHPLTARLFGFPSAIAHGMWTKARCLAALSAQLPDAFTAEAAFRKPIILPATVAFAVGEAGDGAGDGAAAGAYGFGVRDASKPDTRHLDGRLTP